MSVFLAEELLPLMAGLWPGEVYSQQIREAVLLLGEDADRQYAPRPSEVRGVILRNNPVPRAAAVGRQVSLRVCEMEAEVRVYLRDRSVPAEEVTAELLLVLAEKARHGVAVIGEAT